MSNKPQIDIPTAEIAGFAQHWQVQRLALFGSVLREDFDADSDIDLLVDFQESVTPTLDDWLMMQDELTAILGRAVDLVERKQVEQSENYIRQRHILNTAYEIFNMEG